MKIRRLTIDIRPTPYSNNREHLLLRVSAYIEGEEFHFEQLLDANHFASVFDALMERAAKKIKELVSHHVRKTDVECSKADV